MTDVLSNRIAADREREIRLDELCRKLESLGFRASLFSRGPALFVERIDVSLGLQDAERLCADLEELASVKNALRVIASRVMPIEEFGQGYRLKTWPCCGRSDYGGPLEHAEDCAIGQAQRMEKR